jgi:hypothetical protein
MMMTPDPAVLISDGAGADVVVEPELALREEIEDAFLQVYLFRAFLLLLSD